MVTSKYHNNSNRQCFKNLRLIAGRRPTQKKTNMRGGYQTNTITRTHISRHIHMCIRWMTVVVVVVAVVPPYGTGAKSNPGGLAGMLRQFKVYVGPSGAYVGPPWAHVGPARAYNGPSWAYLRPMLA